MKTHEFLALIAAEIGWLQSGSTGSGSGDVWHAPGGRAWCFATLEANSLMIGRGASTVVWREFWLEDPDLFDKIRAHLETP